MHMKCIMSFQQNQYNTCIYLHNLNHTNILCNFTIHYTKNYLTWANYQIRAIQLELLDQTHFHTKIYFRVTIHMNSKTPGLLFTANHPIIVSFCEPEFHGHFRPHIHHNTNYCTNFFIYNPNSSWIVTDCPHGFPKISHLGSKIWNRSTGRSRPQTNRNINKALKLRVKQVG